MCQVVQDPCLKSWFSSLLGRVESNIRIGSKKYFLTKYDDLFIKHVYVFTNTALHDGGTAFGEKSLLINDILKKRMSRKSVSHGKLLQSYDLFKSLSKKERAATTTTMEDFFRSSQAPSSTHPETTFPIRANSSLRL